MGPATWDWHRGTTSHRSGSTLWGLGIEKCLLQGTLRSTQRWDIMKRAMRGHSWQGGKAGTGRCPMRGAVDCLGATGHAKMASSEQALLVQVVQTS